MTVFDNFCTVGNRNEYSTKQAKQRHFNLTKSPLYLVKLKIAQNDRLLTAVRSVKPTVSNFPRKSFNVHFFVFLENSFSSLLTESILRSGGFYQQFIVKLTGARIIEIDQEMRELQSKICSSFFM